MFYFIFGKKAIFGYLKINIMKRFILPLMVAFVLTGCSTYQYSSRSVYIKGQQIGTKNNAAELVVDYNRTVTATSDYQTTRAEAIREAEYKCINDNKIDVVVDPIIKIEHSPLQLQNKYRATVTGYAGTYKEVPTGVDAVKDYKMEDVEKYKMLTDPCFPQYYYNKSTGDSYYINSTAKSVQQKASSLTSLAVAPKTKKLPVKPIDIFKAKQIRNAGVYLTIGGLISTFAIGLPCMMNAYQETSYYNSYGGYWTYGYECNYAMEAAGIAFLTIGSAATAAGVPMWAIGAVKMKKSGKTANISVGNSSNGVGLRLNF